MGYLASSHLGAYWAGLIDGEARVAIARNPLTKWRKTNGDFYFNYSPRIVIRMKQPYCLVDLARTFDLRIRQENPYPRTVHTIHITGQKCIALCSMIHPFIILKKLHVELILATEWRTRRGPHDARWFELKALHEGTFWSIKALNKLGRGIPWQDQAETR